MAQDQEDEWEYIFDESETQTLIFTVDLSATVSGANTGATGKSSKKNDKPNGRIADAGRDFTPTANANRDEPSSIQFLDLPSKAPYISYKGQVFVGTWGQTIGSDLIFAATSDLPEDVKPVMQSQDDQWCLLGVSNTTLVAKPTELIKRDATQTQPLPASTSGSLTSRTRASQAKNSTQRAKPFSIRLQSDADARQKRQAAFLEQLQAIKIAKGEEDTVYIGRTVKYVDAAGKAHQGAYLSKHEWEELEGSGSGNLGGRLRRVQRGGRPSSQNLPTQDSQDNPAGENDTGHDLQDVPEEELRGSADENGEPEPDNRMADDSESNTETSNYEPDNAADEEDL